MSTRIAEGLRALLSATGLTVDQLAEQVGTSAGQLQAASAGTEGLAPDVLARCALLAGLEPDEFARGAALESPPLALLRTAVDQGGASLGILREDRVPIALGELTHRARMVDQIERRMAVERPRTPAVAVPPVIVGQTFADEAAQRARDALGVPDGPIDSLRALLEGVGVLVVWSQDEVPDDLLGASILRPLPTVLVNLLHGPQNFGHSRMTLAHELGHLLFDHLRRGLPAMYSPGQTSRASPFADFEEIERNANAFAACFLAPATVVRDVVGARDPGSDDAVIAVARRCGVNRVVAINRLTDVYHLEPRVRSDMEYRRQNWTRDLTHPDIPDDSDIGLRRGAYRRRVVAALDAGLLSRERTWGLLGLSPTEPLPEAASEAIRAPLVSTQQVVMGLVRGILDRREARTWSPVQAREITTDHWRVDLVEGLGRVATRGIYMTVTVDGRVVDTNLPPLADPSPERS